MADFSEEEAAKKSRLRTGSMDDKSLGGSGDRQRSQHRLGRLWRHRHRRPESAEPSAAIWGISGWATEFGGADDHDNKPRSHKREKENGSCPITAKDDAVSCQTLRGSENYPRWSLSWEWRASLIAQLTKNPPAVQEILVWFLDGEDPLEKG